MLVKYLFHVFHLYILNIKNKKVCLHDFSHLLVTLIVHVTINIEFSFLYLTYKDTISFPHLSKKRDVNSTNC